jgi:hypothetical protein
LSFTFSDRIDEIDVEGFETGVGTVFLNKGNPAKEDAHLVTLLRLHGAIIIGKSTMHEIGKLLLIDFPEKAIRLSHIRLCFAFVLSGEDIAHAQFV